MALSPETIIALIGLFVALPPTLMFVSKMRSWRWTPGRRQTPLASASETPRQPPSNQAHPSYAYLLERYEAGARYVAIADLEAGHFSPQGPRMHVYPNGRWQPPYEALAGASSFYGGRPLVQEQEGS